MVFSSILGAIGNTPHIRLSKLYPTHAVWVKLEKSNPGGSIKDRIALAMIEDAEEKGILKPGSVIIEPTSGNTGVGLAMVAAAKGYSAIIVMPESMSIERRRIITALGARLELTPRELGMKGAIEKAKELAATIANSFIPSQFDNPANVAVHARTTAQEILNDFPDGIDVIITGAGTGGHITACADILKQHWKNLKVYAVEPVLSQLLAGGTHQPHPIQGISPGFIASILRPELLDGTITVSKEEAFEYTAKIARQEGVLVGISSGASLAAVAKKIEELPAETRILTFNYDTGERYWSVDGLFA